ncbi:MBL fold metallo-hydrolase [Candidatus Chloroploca asiatica]|uniref:Zn-dependent hydrolase n=1 Tax=Candidatus Chloroploca asiatica TaxID=1506545 RepID=A0A2H3KHG6_9CHLR|nr:MBL fold metallo-hydrolase [Candidatus Chloroploca asiatica]PDV97219.1 Zn-dependent hydrolase [Candidatus Chloroploca asiatica]
MPDVQFLGHACFRLRGRDGTVLCDPFNRSIGLDIGRPTAHIVTISHNHADHNNVAAVKPLREKLFVVESPGEYEVSGIMITGVRTYHDKERGAERGYNTVYVIHLDEVVFCHLGDLGHELTQAQLEAIGNVDVLFVPVGGGETIGPAEAINVISQIEPRIVVPMHYALAQLSFDEPLLPLERFTTEMGLKEMSAEDKLTLNASQLTAEREETRLVVLRPILG